LQLEQSGAIGAHAVGVVRHTLAHGLAQLELRAREVLVEHAIALRERRAELLEDRGLRREVVASLTCGRRLEAQAATLVREQRGHERREACREVAARDRDPDAARESPQIARERCVRVPGEDQRRASGTMWTGRDEPCAARVVAALPRHVGQPREQGRDAFALPGRGALRMQEHRHRPRESPSAPSTPCRRRRARSR
jgi:hypothetical protein